MFIIAGCFSAPAPAHADRRVALVIGNGAYKNAPRLPNPKNDAEDVAAALKRSGFETIVGLDLDKADMDDATIRFARAAREADVAIFYYSGHAMQFSGINYLMPVDVRLSDEADLRRMARVDDIVADIQQAKNLRILVLDSCRDNPLAEELKRSVGRTRAAAVSRGLAKIDSPQGMIIAYSTQAGRTAEDGRGRNSPYTAAFLKHIEAAAEIGTVFRRVTADVYEDTKRAQLPELSMSLVGEFYLGAQPTSTLTKNVLAPNSVQSTPASDPCAFAAEHWRSAESIGGAEAYRDHLARFPNCTFSSLARTKIVALSAQVPSTRFADADWHETVRSFYLALGASDGARASSLVVPEKRNTGPFSAYEITKFYSSLTEPLRLGTVTSMGENKYQVSYTYRVSRTRVCDGAAIVTLVDRGGQSLIEAIKSLRGC